MTPDISLSFRLATVAAALALGAGGCDQKPADADQTPPGKSVVFDSASEGIDPAALESMRWEDVAPSAEKCASEKLTGKTLEAAAKLSSPPIVYFRGLLKFGAGDASGAQSEWSAIDLAQIPPDYLYLPWRVAAATPGAPNRYDAPLMDAVGRKEAGPLVRARVHSFRGEWRDALDAYLLSDPANWSPFELRTFGAMRLQAPHSRDAAVVIAGALKGGRVPPALRAEFARLVKEAPSPDSTALAEKLRENPELAKAAVAGAAKILATRQAFASNRFQDVVDRARETDPMQATDETALLVFLSAAKLKDGAVADLWSAELLRRHPGEENRKWIQAILNDAR